MIITAATKAITVAVAAATISEKNCSFGEREKNEIFISHCNKHDKNCCLYYIGNGLDSYQFK